MSPAAIPARRPRPQVAYFRSEAGEAPLAWLHRARSGLQTPEYGSWIEPVKDSPHSRTPLRAPIPRPPAEGGGKVRSLRPCFPSATLWSRPSLYQRLDRPAPDGLSLIPYRRRL